MTVPRSPLRSPLRSVANPVFGGIASPVNTVLPVISGTAMEGETLSTTDGTWLNAPTGYTYQWKDGGVAISGATASTYELTAAEVGGVITVTVTATNAGGSTGATSAGTDPVAEAGDPDFASVVLLTGFDGVDAATTATDDSNSAHSFVFIGNAQIDTAQKMFGSGSLLLDGTGDKVDIADSANWNFGAGDFTIEAFIRFSNLTGFQTIICQWDATVANDRVWMFDFPGSANNVLRFGYSTNGTAEAFVQGAWTPSVDTWYHVAAERSGATIRLYAGPAGGSAAMVATASIGASSLSDQPEGVRIGALYTTIDTNYFKGWIDELRITKGVARYASDAGYTVPTEAFLRS